MSLGIAAATSEWTRRPDGSYFGGGTQFYRLRVPLARLEAAGHDVTIGRLAKAPGGRLAVAPPGARQAVVAPVVVLQRYMDGGLADAIRAARAAGQVVISDVDDWFDGLPPSNRAYWSTHPQPWERLRGLLRIDAGVEVEARACQAMLARGKEGHRILMASVPTWKGGQAEAAWSMAQIALEDNRDHYRRATAASDLITASTDYLAERLRSLGPPIEVLRNALELDGWDLEPQRETTEPVIGWYASLGHRASGDTAILRAVLPRWLRGHPDRRFVWGGHHGEPLADVVKVFGLDGLEDRLDVRSSVNVLELRELLRGIDVGLVPLELAPFNEAKSALKALEFSAAGIPTVASPTSENRWLSASLLAKSPDDWLKALDRLRDPAARALLAERARGRAEDVSIARTWRGWQQAYEGALERRGQAVG